MIINCYETHNIFKDYNGHIQNISCFLSPTKVHQYLGKKEEVHKHLHKLMSVMKLNSLDIVVASAYSPMKCWDDNFFTNNDPDTPIQINTTTIDIEDVLQMELDILTLKDVRIKNVHLLKYYKGRHLTIYRCPQFYDPDYPLNDYSMSGKKFTKDLRDAITQMPNLISLTCITDKYFSFYPYTATDMKQLKFKYDFFEKLKTLKSLIVPRGSVVKYHKENEIDVYYYDIERDGGNISTSKW
jgi:hypothetical protein